jgi:hypothetical protein
MKNAIFMLLFAGMVFGASAAGSMYLQQRQGSTPHAESSDAEHGGEAEQRLSGHHAPIDDSSGPGAESAAEEGSPGGGMGLPAAVRPAPVSVEELLKYSLGLKSREERIVEREKEIERKQAQADIVQADIEGEQTELDGLRTQVKEELESVERLLTQIGEERQKFEAEKAESEEHLKELRAHEQQSKASEVENIKQLSIWFQSMDPEKAATVINQLAKDGKIDLAVQLLSNFEDREASKILSAIEDTTLTVQLADAFREYQKPTKKPEKKR